MDNYEQKIRVNGALMEKFDGMNVVIIGTILNVEPSGNAITLKASDGKAVNVVMEDPVQEGLGATLEVVGKVHRGSIQGLSYTLLPQGPDFDMATYDETVRVLHSTDNPFKTAMHSQAF